MAAIRCPKCGHFTSDKLNQCLECGSSLDGLTAQSSDETLSPHDSPRRKKHALKRRTLILCVLFALLIGGVAFFLVHDRMQKADEEQAAFDKLMSCQRVELCEDYLIHFPEGAHAQEVQQLCAELQLARQAELQLDSADWARAQQMHTAEAYEEYLAKHPVGDFIQQAESELNRLSQLMVSDEEKSMLTGSIHALLASLSAGDAAKVAPLLAERFSFGGLEAANADSLVAFYNAQFCHKDILGVHFVVKGNLEATKQPNGEPSQFDYEVHAKLDATLNRTAVDSAGVQHWELTARLTSDRHFSQVSLSRK